MTYKEVSAWTDHNAICPDDNVPNTNIYCAIAKIPPRTLLAWNRRHGTSLHTCVRVNAECGGRRSFGNAITDSYEGHEPVR